jgi:OOP family OmpA-OmpF porin
MRLSFLFAVGATFLLAAGTSLVSARFAANAIERATEIGVRTALDTAAHEWAEVQASGLQVILSGEAPDEATRFNALTVAGDVVDAARVIDNFSIAPTKDLAPPRFSVEILRNDSGISIIGLVPTKSRTDDLLEQLHEIAGEDNVSDLMQNADYPVPDGWQDALDYAVVALEKLPRSKISVSAGQVLVDAISDSSEAKTRLERQLDRAAPAGLRLALDIDAPRPVISPFTLRYTIDENGNRFDACSADTVASSKRILAAAARAGGTGSQPCTIGMGVPSPNWATAAELSIAALAELGRGSVTMSNADITLAAAQGTDESHFDRIIGELETDLPEVFALHAILPPPKDEDQAGPPEFVATLSPEGLVQLRGRLSDANLRQMVDSYAKARFGSDAVYTGTRMAENLPADWAVRVLAGVEALSFMHNGAVTVTPTDLNLRGVTQRENANADISRLLSTKLGEAETFSLDLTYQAPPEPKDKPTEPEECIALIKAEQEASKITFEPGSATIAETSLGTMNDIADILKRCGPIRLEIQGHTDSQGRETMNQQLSQARAQSVLNELRARRVPTASFSAVGYGETRPIKSNDSEAGREANRRIEFWLIEPVKSTPEGDSALEQMAKGAGSDTQTQTDGENN